MSPGAAACGGPDFRALGLQFTRTQCCCMIFLKASKTAI